MPELYFTSLTNTTSTSGWNQWNRQWYATTTTATTISTVDLWRQWNTPTVTVGAGAGVPTWMELARRLAPEPPVPDRLARAEADKLARELLEEYLEPEQLEELRARQRFHVVGADEKTYRLTRGWAHNAFLIEDGIVAEEYCIHPRIEVPIDDHLLAQKLLLETDPAAFRRIANITPMRHLRRVA